MKTNTLGKILGTLAVLLLSGSFAVAGEYFHLQQPDRDSGLPGRGNLTSRGDLADLSRGGDLTRGDRSDSRGGRALVRERTGRQLFQSKPRPKSRLNVIFQSFRPFRVCVLTPPGGRSWCKPL